MATTWAELKSQVIDLGFEEDDIVGDYGRIIRNSINRAFDIVASIVIPQIEGYYMATKSWGNEDAVTGKWTLPRVRHVTEETEEDQRISLPDNLIPLIPLLAAHYIWLDDDVTKAVTYWNEYDQLKDQIIAVCRQPKNSVIEGGW